jgi:hypothetical protein
VRKHRALGRGGSLFGALAQLGERLICIQEVNGSIPLGSTNSTVFGVDDLTIKRMTVCLIVQLDVVMGNTVALTSYREKHQYRLVLPSMGSIWL